MNKAATHAALTLLAALALTACASTQRADTEPAPIAAPIPVYLDGATSAPISLNALADRAAQADAVIFGELHGNPLALAAARELFTEIVKRRPNAAALGLEFYERDHQAHLDDYLADITDEAAFRAAVNKPAEKDSHRDLIETARAASLPVYALNAPRRYARLARTRGWSAYDEMTPEQRRLVAVPSSLTTGRYADEFYALMGSMGGHGETQTDGPSEMAVSFFRAQNVWDETMARTAAEALRDGAQPIFITVGRFHSDFNGGLVERLQQKSPTATILTLTALDAPPTQNDADRADILVTK